MHPTIDTLETRTAQTYRICIASHLPADWPDLAGVSARSTGYDPAGRPITWLLLAAAGQAQLLSILDAIVDAGLTFLSVEWVRDLDAPQA